LKSLIFINYFMNSNTLLLIGRKIKEIRVQKKVKLVELAMKAKISKGLLSQIENNRTIPSLPVLLQIIKVLEVEYSEFFKEVESHASTQLVFRRKEEYSRIEKEDAIGFAYYLIHSDIINNVNLQFNILELSPYAQRDPVTTDGYTYLLIMKGEVEYTLGEESYKLREGDSLFFNGTIPHVPRNYSNEAARIFVLYILPV